MQIRGEGMPHKGNRAKGDLYITFSIDFPGSFSEQQKTMLRKTMAMA
jgi:DnaJ-class molecular chaperone